MLAALVMVGWSAPAGAEPGVHHRHHVRRGFPVFVNPFGVHIPREPFESNPPPLGIPPDLGPDYEPPYVPEPSPAPGPAPYPQGFALDVPIKPGSQGETGQLPTRPLNRYREVADALAQCWNPPADFDDHPWSQVTLRVSFKRDGSINGTPRIPYAAEGLTETARSDLTRSLTSALQRCTPLPLSPSLGGAIAGQVFALRFIEQDQN